LTQRPIRAVFVVDAKPEIGLGHCVRSRALATELENIGVSVSFHVRGVLPKGYNEDKSAPVLGEIGSLKDLAEQAHVVVLDLYHFSSQNMKDLRSFPVSACIDDGTRSFFECDILLNPNVNEEFDHQRAEHTRYLRGGRYIILRQQFDNVQPRRCREVASHFLVAFGGTDPMNLTPRVTKLLRDRRGFPFERITVILGDPSRSRIVKQLVRSDTRFTVVSGVNSICSLMCEADIGLVTAGTMMYEAAVTGLPTLTGSLNEPQAREARAFEEKGAARYLGDARDLRDEDLVNETLHLLSRRRRQRMAHAAQSIIDGKGRKRVADVIVETIQTKLREG
jgi:UDP-2,4-diacetamido-2,4,6-trideoxy-beta-L-altropyranose hydrolase